MSTGSEYNERTKTDAVPVRVDKHGFPFPGCAVRVLTTKDYPLLSCGHTRAHLISINAQLLDSFFFRAVFVDFFPREIFTARGYTSTRDPSFLFHASLGPRCDAQISISEDMTRVLYSRDLFYR